MIPYLAMLGVPSFLALTGVRKGRVTLLVVALFFWIMIGFRFQVGMDWNNYVLQYQYDYYLRRDLGLTDVLFRMEPGFALLNWFAVKTGLGVILVHAVAALVFCWGFFRFAARCPEPFIAIAIATPLLVIAFAMSGIRQATAMGMILMLFATWDERSVRGRILIVLFASLFHFSALFVMIFVALSARVPAGQKVLTVGATVLLLFVIILAAPGAIQSYSELYVSGQKKVDAPGALAQIGVIASAAVVYFLYRRPLETVLGDHPLYRHLAVASLLAIPAALISSVGAYRFALYLWPMAMYVLSGIPLTMKRPEARLAYRTIIIILAFALLVGWMTQANSSWAWLPYKNWLLQPEDVRLARGRVY